LHFTWHFDFYGNIISGLNRITTPTQLPLKKTIIPSPAAQATFEPLLHLQSNFLHPSSLEFMEVQKFKEGFKLAK